MTKERKLSIEMWMNIRERVRTSRITCFSDLVAYKTLFCIKNNIHWTNNCWFCEYIAPRHCGCSHCPASARWPRHGCGRSSPYHLVIYGRTLSQRIRACNKIIKALGGKP